MELLVSLNRKSIEDYLDYTNSFIIGLKDFSINYLEFSVQEIEELLEKHPHINLFVSVNKNIFNDELSDLKNRLMELSKLKINGLLFYDLSILYLVKEYKLSIPLGINQTHLVTSYSNCNYYENKGCSYAYLSSDITEEEMLEISKNTNLQLIVLFLGHITVTDSRRKLISNYFAYNHQKMEKDIYTIKSGDSDEFFIKENDYGTSIITKNILNGIKSFINLKDSISYGLFDEFLMDHDVFLKMLAIFKEINDGNLTKEEELSYINNSEKLIGSYTGFFQKKTIYKVKRNEKN